jgi:hypothetical protein
VTRVGSRICRGSKFPSGGYGRVGLVLVLAAGTYSTRVPYSTYCNTITCLTSLETVAGEIVGSQRANTRAKEPMMLLPNKTGLDRMATI